MTTARTEVLVVGGGLGGAVVAERLARAGVLVTCLEQGRRHDPSEYPGDKPHAEIAALGPWHASPEVRRSTADYPVDATGSEMQPLLFNGVGGSTILYGGHWMRFLPSDFRTWTLDRVGDDWPIDYRALAPFYDAVDAAFGASGVAGDPAYPSRPDYPQPPLPIGRWGERLAAAHTDLGWHWWPGANVILSRPTDGRRACVQRSTCGTGCNEGAKGSTDRTHWPKAERNGARLIPGARVSRIERDRQGRVKGAIFRRDGGPEERIVADRTVLAAGALGTPRLLMLSDGLANRSDLVGRRLMMHPFTRVVGFFDAPLGSSQGHWGQSLYSLEFAETDASRGFLRGAKWNLTPSGGPLTAALFPWPDEPRWGAAMHAHVDEWLGRSAIWGISCEDLPDPTNRVTLDPGRRDSDGNPGVRLSYRMDANARRMLSYNVARATESFEAAGACRTVSLPLMPEFGWHPLGTCRMGRDPETSVVDPFGMAHDAADLWIADASVLVTGSSVNPAATVAALALRTAERMLVMARGPA